MHEIAIQQLDHAALALIQALAKYYDELKPYFEGDQLESLHQDVVNLRRSLLGLQMGPLYWEIPAEIVEQVVDTEMLPIEDAAARAAEMLEQHPDDSDISGVSSA